MRISGSAVKNTRTTFSNRASCPCARPAPRLIIDGGTFAYTALLVCYTYHIEFRHNGVSSFSVGLASRGVTGGYVRA